MVRKLFQQNLFSAVVARSLTNESFEFTFFDRVMSLDMAFQGIICCLANRDYPVTWKTEHALVSTESSTGVCWCFGHNKEITQIPPIVVV
jgi:hypothetical protein